MAFEPTTMTFHDLRQQLADLCGIPVECIRLRQAFPPAKTVAGWDECRSGDTLLIENVPSLSPADDIITPTKSSNTSAKVADKSLGGKMVKREIADDNSCLFSSIGYVLMNHDRSQAYALRQLIASTVQAQPDTYSDLILGRPRHEYCQLIQQPQTWGGAIELRIFAEHFQTEIVAIDVETCRPYRFGEGSGFKQRVFVLYSGIHYDALAMAPFGQSGSEQLDQTVFSVDDDLVFAQALTVAEEEKKARRYTNTATFTLKCLKCNTALIGQDEAQKHAHQTGHTDFSEY